MFDSVLSSLAENREWGLIILLVTVLLLMGKSMLNSVTRTMHERDRVNGEREERMIRVMVGFSESLPKLASAINELRAWLGERFNDLNDDLDDLKTAQSEIGVKVSNHEHRIVRLEENHVGIDPDTRRGNPNP